MNWRSLLFAAGLLGGCEGASLGRDNELLITPRCHADGALSDMTIDGTTITLPAGTKVDSPAIEAQIRKAVGGDLKRPVRLAGSIDLPYRCLGGLVFTLQRMGFAKVGFVAEPPPETDQP